MKKQVQLISPVLFMVLASLTSHGQVDSEFTFSNITYKVTALSPNTVTAIGYKTAGGTVVNIPPTVNHDGTDYDVTAIGNRAFYDKQLTEVTFSTPSSVTSIQAFAFSNNELASVTIPNSVTNIETSAFQNNRLTSVTIPNSVTNIETGAFRNNDLTSVTIPNSVTSIGASAFFENKLRSLTIPNSVTSIGASAFWNNDLTSVTIPNSVTNIEAGAFENNRLTSVTIPNSVTSIETSAFENNRLTSVTIPNSVTNIETSAFENNELASVTIPNSVTSIGARAFAGNTGLDQVTVEAKHPPSLHENAFADRSQVNLVVPVGMRQAYLDNGWDGFKSTMEEGQVITAVSNDELNDLTLYPNPARDKIYIDPGPGQELKQVNIYTMTGAYLYSENGLEINTSRLSEGMYLFEIATQTGDRFMRRVILQ